ncbi:MAG: ESX secretion-associated protein EspG [Acidimicrobiia bacterium]|nr:ESX secretion-associated protein EspG [Acidimicrobiia bacterium]
MTDQAPVATIDHLRRSVCVARRLMPSILAIHAGQQPALSRAATELRAGGILATDELDPLVTTLVEVMTNPQLVISVEVYRSAKPNLATFWATPRRAVVGLTDDQNRFELIQVEPTLLQFHLAQSTGLRPRPSPPFSGSFSLPSRTLRFAEENIATNPIGVETRLRTDRVSAEWTDRLMAALAMRRSLWNVASVWLGKTNFRNESSLSVLDAGFAGYWRLTTTPDGLVTVATTDFDELLSRIDGLLPTTN